MKKQQILLTIGACALISVSFAVLFAYFIPSLYTAFSDPVKFFTQLQQGTPSPTLPLFNKTKTEIRNGSFYINDKLVTLILHTQWNRGAEGRRVHFNAETSDQKTLCSLVDSNKNDIAFLLCTDVESAQNIWSYYFDKSLSSPSSMTIQDNLLTVNFVTPDNRHSKEQFIVDVPKLVQTGEGNSYDLQERLKEKIDVSEYRYETTKYLLHFTELDEGTLEVRSYCRGDCGDSHAGSGRDYSLKLVDNSWQIELTDSGSICWPGRGDGIVETCV